MFKLLEDIVSSIVTVEESDQDFVDFVYDLFAGKQDPIAPEDLSNEPESDTTETDTKELPQSENQYWKLLRPHVPPLWREAAALKLLYSFENDGISINTLYSHCATGPILLIITTDAGDVLGAYSDVGFNVNQHYQGNGTCFLFMMKDGMQVYHSTGKNEYHVLVKSDCLAFGGRFSR